MPDLSWQMLKQNVEEVTELVGKQGRGTRLNEQHVFLSPKPSMPNHHHKNSSACPLEISYCNREHIFKFKKKYFKHIG